MAGREAASGVGGIAMWMHYLRGFRTQPAHIADLIPWVEGDERQRVIRCKDGSLLAVWQIDPKDMARLSPEEQGSLMLALNTAWKRIQGGWGIWHERVRLPATLPSGCDQGAHPVATLIEEAHRRDYDPSLWADTVYLTIHRQAPRLPWEETVESLLYSGSMEHAVESASRRFDEGSQAIIDVLRTGVEGIAPVTGDALARYLHGLVSDHDQPVAWGDGHGLDYALADSPLITGLSPQLGDQYFVMVSVRNFPDEVWSDMLAAVRTLPFGFRQMVRWLPRTAETNQREMTRLQEQHASTKHRFKDSVIKWLTKKEPEITNTFADHQEKDTDAAKFSMQTEDVSYGDWCMTVRLQDETESVAQGQAREVERVLRARGLVTVRERLNSVEALLGSWPGLPLRNPRQFKLSSSNGLLMAPWQEPWGGIPYNTHLQAPALCLAKTSQCMPFWLTPWADDVGHLLMFGPSGSGKTAPLTFLASCVLSRYAKSRLRTLDFKRAARAFYLCLEAPYRDFARDTIPLQPYAYIGDPQERTWAYEWTLDRIEDMNTVLTASIREYVENSLRSLAGLPSENWTMSGFRYVMGTLRTPARAPGVSQETLERLRVEKADVVRAIDAMTSRGPYGRFYDMGRASDADHRVEAYELQGLLATPRVVPGVVSLLAHRRQLTGAPTILILHEASRYLKFPSFVKQIDEDLRLLRDKNWSLWLETQDADDLLDTTVQRLLLNNCPTRVLSPNPQATSPAIQPAYEAIGLRHPAIAQIAQLHPKRDMYVQCPDGEAAIHLPLTPVAQAICGASRTSDHAGMDMILDRYGPKNFTYHWLQWKQLPDAAERFKQLRGDMDDADGDADPGMDGLAPVAALLAATAAEG